MTEFHVLIIGAGPSGLLLAQALKKSDIKFTVFEAAAGEKVYRTGQWAFTSHWSTPYIKALVPDGIWERIETSFVDSSQIRSHDLGDPDSLNIYNASNGAKLFAPYAPHQFRHHRSKLRNLLAEGICVQYNKKVVSLSETCKNQVTVNFEDGTSTTGSLLVGADGPFSKCRELLVGKQEATTEPASTPEMPVTIVTAELRNLKAEQALDLCRVHPIFCNGVHPAGASFFLSTLDVPDSNDPGSWAFKLLSTWRCEKEPSREQNMLPSLKEWIPRLVGPCRTFLESLPNDLHLKNQRFGFWRPSPRGNLNGRATLVGDAAHLTGPWRGQGWNQCVADVKSLTDRLQEHLSGRITLKGAVDAYDAEAIPRAREEVSLSHQNFVSVLHWERVLSGPMAKIGFSQKSDVATPQIGERFKVNVY